MPVYSEVLEDQEILNFVRGKYTNVLVVGCGSCMNESLSYLHNTPIFIKEGNDDIPYSVHNEAERLTTMFNAEGINSTYIIIPKGKNARCMINLDEDIYQLSMDSHPDVILAMCCPSGVHGLVSSSNGVKIIKITKQCGFLAYSYRINNEGTHYIVKEKSSISRLK